MAWLANMDDLDSEATFAFDISEGAKGDDKFLVQLCDGDNPFGEAIPLKTLRDLPKMVKSDVLLQHIRQLLSKVGGDSADAFAVMAEFEGIRWHPGVLSESSSRTVAMLADQFVVALAMPKSLADALKILESDEEDPEFRATTSLKMMRDLFNKTNTATIDLIKGIVKSPVTNVGMDAVMSMCSRVTWVHGCASVMLYLRQELTVVSGALVEHVLRDDIKHALAVGLD